MGRQRVLQPLLLVGGLYLVYRSAVRPSGRPLPTDSRPHPEKIGRRSPEANHPQVNSAHRGDTLPPHLHVKERSAAEAAWGEVKNPDKIKSVEIRSRRFDYEGPNISPTRMHGQLGTTLSLFILISVTFLLPL